MKNVYKVVAEGAVFCGFFRPALMSVGNSRVLEGVGVGKGYDGPFLGFGRLKVRVWTAQSPGLDGLKYGFGRLKVGGRIGEMACIDIR